MLMAVVELPSGAFDAPQSEDPRLLLFDGVARATLAYADAMTQGDVDDQLFERIRALFSPDEIVELTAVIAWENASARFNRALRVPSQGLWQRSNLS